MDVHLFMFLPKKMINGVMDEMDASLYTIPEIVSEMDRHIVTSADTIYAENNIMDQIYEQEEDKSVQERLNEHTMATIISDEIKAFDSDYGLTPVTVSPHYEPVTSKMTKNHQPVMSEVQIMSEITDSVTKVADRDIIFNLVRSLQTNQPEMTIFHLSVIMEGTPLKYRVSLDVPYDTVVKNETKDLISRNSQWPILWTHSRLESKRSQFINLVLSPVYLQYEPVTSKMTKNHQPPMSEVQIMSEITDTVTNVGHRDTIFNIITTLQANQPEMSIFDVRICIEKGSPSRYRVTLDIPYDTVTNKETKDRVARSSQWNVQWFLIRQDMTHRQCLTLTLTPIVDNNLKDTEKKEAVIFSDVKPLLMNTREVYRLIDGCVSRPMNEDITDIVDSLVAGKSSPSITSFEIKRDPTQIGVYNIVIGLHQTECGHGGGITLTTLNNITEAFTDTWDLAFRIMFDLEGTLCITATYLKSTQCLTKEDVINYVDTNAVMSMDRFPVKKMIQFITGDTKMGIHALEIKRVDDERFSVSMDVEKCRPVSLEDDIDVIKLFNNSWSLSFQHDLMGSGPIRRIVITVTRRSYLTTL